MPVPRAGRYRVWLGGTFGRGVEVRLAGRKLGRVSYQMGWEGQFFDLGTQRLSAGRQVIALERPKGAPRGGDGFPGDLLSRVMLTPARVDRRVRRISPQDARRLCSRRLDWVEIVKR